MEGGRAGSSALGPREGTPEAIPRAGRGQPRGAWAALLSHFFPAADGCVPPDGATGLSRRLGTGLSRSRAERLRRRRRRARGVGVVSIALFILISQAAEPIRAELRKGRSASYFVGVPAGGSGARVTAGRSWRALAIDSLGRSWPASAEVAAADAKDAIQWFAVRGELPGIGESWCCARRREEASDGAAGVEPLLLRFDQRGNRGNGPRLRGALPRRGRFIVLGLGGASPPQSSSRLRPKGRTDRWHRAISRPPSSRPRVSTRRCGASSRDACGPSFVPWRRAWATSSWRFLLGMARIESSASSGSRSGSGCHPKSWDSRLAAMAAAPAARRIGGSPRGARRRYFVSAVLGAGAAAIRWDRGSAAGIRGVREGGALAVFVERFERREPMAIALHRDGNLGIEILADPRPLDQGKRSRRGSGSVSFLDSHRPPSAAGRSRASPRDSWHRSIGAFTNDQGRSDGWRSPSISGFPSTNRRGRVRFAHGKNRRGPRSASATETTPIPRSRAAIRRTWSTTRCERRSSPAPVTHRWDSMGRAPPPSTGAPWTGAALRPACRRSTRATTAPAPPRKDMCGFKDCWICRSSRTIGPCAAICWKWAKSLRRARARRTSHGAIVGMASTRAQRAGRRGAAPRLRAAADRYARAILELEDETFGVVRVGGREDPSGEGFTWSTWLGGGSSARRSSNIGFDRGAPRRAISSSGWGARSWSSPTIRGDRPSAESWYSARGRRGGNGTRRGRSSACAMRSSLRRSRAWSTYARTRGGAR